MSVGETLAAARRDQQLSVDDLSAVTRIRPHLIQAIEADNFTACGGDVYARGHVRALARQLGVPLEPLLAEMSSTANGSPPLRAPARDPSLVIRERRIAPRWTLAIAVILGIVVCLAALRLLVPSTGGDANKAVERQPLQQNSGQPYVRPSAPPSAAVPAGGGVAMSFTVTGKRCWLSVTGGDGVSKVADVLRRGHTVSVKDKRKLVVVVGSVGDVAVSVNGTPVVLHGSPGSAQRFVVRAKDPFAPFKGTAAGGRSAGRPTA